MKAQNIEKVTKVINEFKEVQNKIESGELTTLEEVKAIIVDSPAEEGDYLDILEEVMSEEDEHCEEDTCDECAIGYISGALDHIFEDEEDQVKVSTTLEEYSKNLKEAIYLLETAITK